MWPHRKAAEAPVPCLGSPPACAFTGLSAVGPFPPSATLRACPAGFGPLCSVGASPRTARGNVDSVNNTTVYCGSGRPVNSTGPCQPPRGPSRNLPGVAPGVWSPGPQSFCTLVSQKPRIPLPIQWESHLSEVTAELPRPCDPCFPWPRLPVLYISPEKGKKRRPLILEIITAA